jgi:hypothetical protein
MPSCGRITKIEWFFVDGVYKLVDVGKEWVCGMQVSVVLSASKRRLASNPSMFSVHMEDLVWLSIGVVCECKTNERYAIATLLSLRVRVCDL